jgi:hypothetical protein
LEKLTASGHLSHRQSANARQRSGHSALGPGKYTAVLAGKNNTTGIGLVEVYDQSPASTAQLSNISSRGSVGTRNDVMIGGFINAVSMRPLGNTTAIVSGKNGTTGVALLEVYRLP